MRHVPLAAVLVFSVPVLSASVLSADAPSPVAANSWFQLTATYDGHTASLYIDGVAVATQVLPSGYAPSGTLGLLLIILLLLAISGRI